MSVVPKVECTGKFAVEYNFNISQFIVLKNL